MRLSNKRVIVVGGSRGIGRAIAIKMTREGATVAFTYCSDNKSASSVVHEIESFKGKGRAFFLNLTQPETFLSFTNEVLDYLQGCDVLINNAGIANRKSFLEIPITEFDNIWHLNLRGPFFLSQAMANKMRDQGCGGSIIHISSISDRVSTLGLTHYESSKAALSMLTKGMALELAQYNIRVNAVSPGLVATGMNKNQREAHAELWQKRIDQIPIGRAGKPEDIVGAVCLLASDEASWMTGSIITVDGGRTII